METLPCTSGSDDAAAYHAVFVDTSLDTHLATIVSDTDTVSNLKKRIQQEHSLCFPDVGEIKIVALKVKRKGKKYHLSDSMFVKSAFRNVSDSWFLSADASAVKGHSKNYKPHIPVSGNLIGFRSMDANTSADVVDLLPDGLSKRSSNLEDTFLLQDENNQFIKHHSVVSHSHSRDYTKGISENLQIGTEDDAYNNPRVLSCVAGNGTGRNDEGQRDSANLSVCGKFSKPREPVKEKRDRECGYAIEKSLGENRITLNSVRESSRREITSSGEGEKGVNEEYSGAIVDIQDHMSAGEALQSGGTTRRLREAVTEGGEKSLAETVNFDSVKEGTRLEVRRSSNNVEGENVDYHNGFISTRRSKLMENPNAESLRIMATVGRHVDGEASTALAFGSISAGQSFSEQCIASPEKKQELLKKNNVMSTMYYDADQADIGDMERQNEEPELGLSSENLGSTQVDHHPDESGDPPFVVQQPTDLGDVVLEHSKRTVTPGGEMVEPKRSSKETNQTSKTHDQVRPEAYGRGNSLRGLMRKEDPSYISEHPINLDSGHDDRSGVVECEVEEPKITTKKVKKCKKNRDPVEAEAAADVEKSEDTPSMVPLSDRGDHLNNEGQAFGSQQSSDLKKDGKSLHDIGTDRPESEVVERKKSSKKKRKSKKTEDQGRREIASGVEHSGGPPHNVSSDEVPTSVRGSGLTDANTKEDPPSLSQQLNNLHEDEVSENHNGFVTFEAPVLEPRKNSKKRKGSNKTLDQVGLETASGLEHSGLPTNDVSSVKVPKSVRGGDMIDSSPKDNPPSLSLLPNNLLRNVVSKYDDRSATLETIAVEPKTKKRKKSRHTQDEVGVETAALLERSGGPRNDISSAEVPTTACADDLTGAVLGDDPPFASQQPSDLRHGVPQLGNGSGPLEANSLKIKRNAKDRKKSRKTQYQGGIEESSITGHSRGATNDISVSEVTESTRGSYLGDITGKLDLLSASRSPNNPLVASVSLNDNKSGKLEAEVGKPTKSLKRTKKTNKMEDHAGGEMSLRTEHFGEPTKDVSQILTSMNGDHSTDVATDEVADNRIRNVLDSLQQSETDEPNAADGRSSKKAKKQKSSVVDLLTQISNDASHKDHGVSAPDVDKVKHSLKSTKKSKKLNSSSINQLSMLNLKVENGREINNLPRHAMAVMGSPSTLSLTDEGILLEASLEKDGPDHNEGLQKGESIENQNRSNIVAGGQVSNGNQTNSKDFSMKVQVSKIKKKLDQPLSEPSSVSSPKLNENEDRGVEIHVEVPVSDAKSAQTNKLKFTSKDAQKLDATVKSSHGKAKTELLVSVTNTNKKSDDRKPKVTVRNSSQKNGSEVVNSSKPMRSLFGSALFKDSIEESSDDEDETNDSDTSTRTPSNNSALLDNPYNESDTDADSRQTGQKDGGKSVTQARYVSPKDKSLVEIMKSSSRYKKAKLVAAESQVDDEDDEEFVPDSQPR